LPFLKDHFKVFIVFNRNFKTAFEIPMSIFMNKKYGHCCLNKILRIKNNNKNEATYVKQANTFVQPFQAQE